MRVLPLLFIALGLLPGCSPRSVADGRYLTFGAVIDRTGNNAEPSWGDAIQLATEHFNQALIATGFKGLQVEFIVSDSQNEPSIAVPRALDLVRSFGVKGLISDTSQNAIGINRTNYDDDASNDVALPNQCGGCTSGSIGNPAFVDEKDPINQAANRNAQKWLFRSTMAIKGSSLVIVREFLRRGDRGDVDGDGRFKIAVYAADEVFGRATGKDVSAFAKQLRGDAIVEELYHPRDVDVNSYAWSADLAKLTDDRTGDAVDGKPDALVVSNFALQAASTFRAYRQSGSAVKMLLLHTFRINSAIQSLGRLADGAEGVSHVLLEDGPSGEVFAREFTAFTGSEPVYRDSSYYDNAMTLFLAAAIAAAPLADPTTVTPAAIRDARLKTDDPTGEVVRTGVDELSRALRLISEGRPINYEGASSPMDLNANQGITTRLALYRVDRGRFIDVKKFDCVKDPVECPELPQ